MNVKMRRQGEIFCRRSILILIYFTRRLMTTEGSSRLGDALANLNVYTFLHLVPIMFASFLNVKYP